MPQLNFKGDIPGMSIISGTNSLMQWSQQAALLFKRVDTMAQAVTAGGFIVFDSTSGDYAWFIGDAARRAAARGVYFFDHFVGWNFQPGDGGSVKGYRRSYSIPSGIYTMYVRGTARAVSTTDLIVVAIVSNAATGYGCNAPLLLDPDVAKEYPAELGYDAGLGSFLGFDWPVDGIAKVAPMIEFPVNRDRGSIMVPVALPKKKLEIIREQRKQITEGSGKGQKYIDPAIDRALSGKEEILYLPMVTSWRGKGASTAIAVGHTVRDLKSDTATVEPMIARSQHHSTRPGEPWLEHLYPQYVQPQKDNQGSFAQFTGDTRSDRPTTPAGGKLIEKSWSIFRSYEGRPMTLDGMSVPCPYFPDDVLWHDPQVSGGGSYLSAALSLGRGEVLAGLNQSLSTYAGVDTSWLLKGALPWLVMNKDGTRKQVGWSGALGLSQLMPAPINVEMPSREVPLVPLSENPSSSEIKQRAQDEKNALARVAKSTRTYAGWEGYFSPIPVLEAVIAKIYDEAYKAAEADN